MHDFTSGDNIFSQAALFDLAWVDESVSVYDPACLEKVDPDVKEDSDSSELKGRIFRPIPHDTICEMDDGMDRHYDSINDKPTHHLSDAVVDLPLWFPIF